VYKHKLFYFSQFISIIISIRGQGVTVGKVLNIFLMYNRDLFHLILNIKYATEGGILTSEVGISDAQSS